MVSQIISTPLERLPDHTLHEKMEALSTHIDLHLTEELVQLKIDEFKSQLLEQGKSCIFSNNVLGVNYLWECCYTLILDG